MKLNDLEKTIIKHFLFSKNSSIDNEKIFFSDILVKERDITQIGFFTYFEKLDKLKPCDTSETYTFSKLGAKINHSIETGYLIYVRDGYIDCVEGFTYGQPWPDTTSHIEPYSI